MNIRFTLSFTSFAELQNDEHTRTFLVMEIGAGHHEVRPLPLVGVVADANV